MPPIGEARGDMEWMWDLAKRLGMGADFWNGDVMATLDWQLEPLGIKAIDLMKEPKGKVIRTAPAETVRPVSLVSERHRANSS